MQVVEDTDVQVAGVNEFKDEQNHFNGANGASNYIMYGEDYIHDHSHDGDDVHHDGYGRAEFSVTPQTPVISQSLSQSNPTTSGDHMLTESPSVSVTGSPTLTLRESLDEDFLHRIKTSVENSSRNRNAHDDAYAHSYGNPESPLGLSADDEDSETQIASLRRSLHSKDVALQRNKETINSFLAKTKLYSMQMSFHAWRQNTVQKRLLTRNAALRRRVHENSAVNHSEVANLLESSDERYERMKKQYEDFCAELLEHIQRQEVELQSSEQRALEKSMFMWQQTQSGTQHIDPIEAAQACHTSSNPENNTQILRKQLEDMRLEHRNLQERVQEEVENARNHAEITLKDAELCWKRERDLENAKWRKTVLDDQERRWSAKMAETLEEQERAADANLNRAEEITRTRERELDAKSQALSALQVEHEMLRLRVEAADEKEDINNANVIQRVKDEYEQKLDEVASALAQTTTNLRDMQQLNSVLESKSEGLAFENEQLKFKTEEMREQLERLSDDLESSNTAERRKVDSLHEQIQELREDLRRAQQREIGEEEQKLVLTSKFQHLEANLASEKEMNLNLEQQLLAEGANFRSMQAELDRENDRLREESEMQRKKMLSERSEMEKTHAETERAFEIRLMREMQDGKDKIRNQYENLLEEERLRHQATVDRMLNETREKQESANALVLERDSEFAETKKQILILQEEVYNVKNQSREEVHAEQQKLEERERRITHLESENADLEKRLTSVRKNAESELAELKNQVVVGDAESKSQVVAAENKCAEIQSKHADLISRFEGKEQECMAIAARNQALERMTNALDDKNVVLEQNLANAKANIMNLTEQLQEQRQELVHKTSELSAAKQQLSALGEEFSSARRNHQTAAAQSEATIAELVVKMQEFSGSTSQQKLLWTQEQEHMQKVEADLRGQITSLRNQLESSERQHLKTQAEAAAAAGRGDVDMSCGNDSAGHYREELEKSQSLLEEMRQKVDSTEQALVASRKSEALLEAKLERMPADNNANIIGGSAKKIAQLEKDRDGLQEELKLLVKEYSEIRAERDILRQRLDI